MKKYFKSIVLFVSVFLLMGCDGSQAIEGLIIDSESHIPISDVMLLDLEKGDTLDFTSDKGFFEIYQVKGFPIGDKELTVIVSKKDFIKDTITFVNNESRLIKMISTK